jgi:23S rRNA pseudouridine1911/1915/1917 synthase
LKLVDYAKDHLIVVPVSAVGALIAAGALRVDGLVGGINDEVAGDGGRITVEAAAIAAIAIEPQLLPIEIVHVDDELVICDKPAGMHVHPLGTYRQGTLLNALLWHAGARPDQPWGRWRPRPLHRLDRAATGLMAFGKTARMHDLDRRYRALVHGTVTGDAGTIDAPLARDPVDNYRRSIVATGQRAVTHWRVTERLADRTWIELTLDTGRTHQIRAHLASIGHPIVGDALYAGTGHSSPAIELHAHELRIGDRTWHSSRRA